MKTKHILTIIIFLFFSWHSGAQNFQETVEIETLKLMLPVSLNFSNLHYSGIKNIALLNNPYSLLIFDLSTLKLLKIIEHPDFGIDNTALSGNGLFAATSYYESDAGIKLWEVETGELIGSYSFSDTLAIQSIKFSENNNYLYFHAYSISDNSVTKNSELLNN